MLRYLAICRHLAELDPGNAGLSIIMWWAKEPAHPTWLGHARAIVGDGQGLQGLVEAEVDLRVFERVILVDANDAGIMGVLNHLADCRVRLGVDAFAQHAQCAGKIDLDFVFLLHGWFHL